MPEGSLLPAAARGGTRGIYATVHACALQAHCIKYRTRAYMIHIYIYIYRERERCALYIYIYIHTHMYIYIYIYT